MPDLLLFICSGGNDLELAGLVDSDDEPRVGECDACGEPLELDADDETAPYKQVCGYCGRPIYGGHHVAR